MKKNVIARVLRDALRDKRFIGATIRIKKSGRFSKINGQVHAIKVNQDGRPYALVENFFRGPKNGKKRWQCVCLENVLIVRKDGMIYKN